MTEIPRGYRGEVKIDKPIAEYGPVGPWQAWVRVLPTQLQRMVIFQVTAEWTGPPAPYMPADPNPGARQDVYNCGADLELAKFVAGHAQEALGRGEMIDLRELAQHLRARRSAGPYG
jgi:hypothetical protein